MSSSAELATYSREFFDRQEVSSYESGRVVLDALFNLYRPHSVVDVGCGVGSWLRAGRELGVTDYLGIDGPYVPTDRLWIPPERFIGQDLTRDLDIGRRFDLAVCVEVGEHLPAGAAAILINTLTRLAPVVLFSAAVPLQGGDGHVNEQWPAYWASLFRGRGFDAHDCLRSQLWNDDRIDWWYRQNIFVFARGATPFSLTEAAAELLPLVHPGMVQSIVTRRPASAPDIPAPPLFSTPSGLRRGFDRVRRRLGALIRLSKKSR